MYICIYIYIYHYTCIHINIYIYIYTYTYTYIHIHTHAQHAHTSTHLHPVRIARIRLPRVVPRVGLPRNLFLIGSLTAALRFSKGWVRQTRILDCELGVCHQSTIRLPVTGMTVSCCCHYY